MQANLLLAVLATFVGTVLVQIKIMFKIKQNKYKTNNVVNKKKKNVINKLLKLLSYGGGSMPPPGYG